jgi:hypothetical protein
MLDHVAMVQAAARVAAIPWHYDPTHHQSQLALMVEYLRRSALWYTALRLPPPRRPFSDIAARALPDSIVASPLIAQAEQDAIAGGGNWYARIVCPAFVRWAGARNHPALRAHTLPPPDEPLIVLFERGGDFTIEDRFIDLAGGPTLYLVGWERFAAVPGLLDLEPATLDAIDQRGPVGSGDERRASA